MTDIQEFSTSQKKTNIPRDDIKKYSQEYVKQYYKDNIDLIKTKRQQKMKCSKCGKIVSKQSVWAHKRSKKCLKVQGLYPEVDTNKYTIEIGEF